MATETDNGKLSINLALVVTMLILSFGILFVSVARAGMEITAAEDSENELRKNEVEFVVNFSDTSTLPGTYKFPEINTLPSNPFYGFKKIRDWLWLQLSQGTVNKARISLILADKKMAESGMLFKDNKADLAIEAGQEALSKLKYSDSLLSEVEGQEAEQLRGQVFKAGFAYSEILKASKDTFETNTTKYDQLVNDINSWNESQKTKKEDLGL